MTRPERQEEYVGKTVFLPIVNAFMPGDILLTFNAESEELKGLMRSKTIRATTGGGFSHALICSSPPTFIEAIGTGVCTLSLARCFAHSLENVRVLRYPDQAIASNAAAIVQRDIGRDYSVARAAKSIFPGPVLDRIGNFATFCSALVAQAYVNAGAQIFTKTPVERTTPATIEKLTELQDITASVFRKALAPNNIEKMSALDGTRAPTPSAKQTEISKNCAKAVFPVAKELSTHFPELSLEIMPTMFGLLEFVAHAFARQEQVPKERQEEFSRQWTALDHQLEEFINAGEYQSFLQEMVTVESSSIQDNIRESYQPTPDIDVEHLRNVYEATNNSLEARIEALQNWKSYAQHSTAVRAYTSIDEKLIEELKQRKMAIEDILSRVG